VMCKSLAFSWITLCKSLSICTEATEKTSTKTFENGKKPLSPKNLQERNLPQEEKNRNKKNEAFKSSGKLNSKLQVLFFQL